jgi:hypothetical protein
LKESQAEIIQLREEKRQMKRKIGEHLDLCEGSLENNKRSLPLHKQMKNLYRQNRTLKAKDRLRKEQIAKRNMDLLAQVAVE